MLDCRSKGPRFDPRPGHENLLKSVTNDARLISLLIFSFVEINNRSGSIITQNSNKNESKIKLFDDPLKS